jgi:MTH538 TIR-like domain (DUF1863)
MSSRQIHVFISHAWDYSDHYLTLVNWIFKEKWSVGQASLDFRDYSIPKDDPIHNTTSAAELLQAINKQVGRCHVVIIPTGMYANHSKWIQKEIDGAMLFQKSILAVNPWGQLRSPSVVAQAADEIVGWNKQPVINAIWKLYKKSEGLVA